MFNSFQYKFCASIRTTFTCGSYSLILEFTWSISSVIWGWTSLLVHMIAFLTYEWDKHASWTQRQMLARVTRRSSHKPSPTAISPQIRRLPTWFFTIFRPHAFCHLIGHNPQYKFLPKTFIPYKTVHGKLYGEGLWRGMSGYRFIQQLLSYFICRSFTRSVFFCNKIHISIFNSLIS